MFEISKESKKAIDKQIKDFQVNFEKALKLNLLYTVELLVNHAKAEHGYQFDTGNLNSSIGGGLYRNGKLVDSVFTDFGENKEEGRVQGIEYLNNIAISGKNTYSIVIVAGMEYASTVENEYNKNVLARTEMIQGEYINRAFKALEKQL